MQHFYSIVSLIFLSFLPVISGGSLRTYTTVYPLDDLTPQEEGRLFHKYEKCLNRCQDKCQVFLIEEDEHTDRTMFICNKIKPVEKSLPEKLLSSAPVPLILCAVVLIVIVLFVCTCLAWGVCGCCRKKTTRRQDNSSREPLHGSGRLEEIFCEEKEALEVSEKRAGSKYSDV